MIPSNLVCSYIPDDEHSVSIEEAQHILSNSDPTLGLFTLLDIIDQFTVLHDQYYYNENLIRLIPILKPKKNK